MDFLRPSYRNRPEPIKPTVRALNDPASQEAQLAQLAAKSDNDAEHLMKDAALRLLEDETRLHDAAPELPVLHLGATTSLHRRDIYDAVR